METAKKSTTCIPGERLCRADDTCSGGKGTHTRNGYIYSTLAGKLQTAIRSEIKYIEVHRSSEQSIVPSSGSIVTAKITNVNQRFCKCSIICIEDVILKEPFRGMIRKIDVRAYEKDKVEMYKCFRSGDIVLARVLSIGDALSYLLSTAENELGVVIAYSEAGHPMIPISWTEMQCPKTYNKELRKIAKIVSSDTVTEASGT